MTSGRAAKTWLSRQKSGGVCSILSRAETLVSTLTPLIWFGRGSTTFERYMNSRTESYTYMPRMIRLSQIVCTIEGFWDSVGIYLNFQDSGTSSGTGFFPRLLTLNIVDRSVS